MQFVPVRYQGSELTAHLLVESPRKDLGTRRNFPVSPLSRFGRFCSCTGVSRGTLSSTRFDTGRKLEGGARTDKVKPRGPQHCPSAASLTRTCFGKWLGLLASCVALMETQAFKYLIYLFNTLEVKFIPSLFMLCLGGRAGWDLQELVPPKIADNCQTPLLG